MIISKNGLRVVDITKTDKKIPALDNVCIEQDGTCVATSGKSLLLVSPVQEQTKSSLKNILQERSNKKELVISSETAKTILKDLPIDKQFKGLLEHCDIINKGEGECDILFTDGKRRRNIVGKVYPRKYLDYKPVIREALLSRDSRNNKTQNDNKSGYVINLKRFLTLLQTIDKICPDSTGESPLWVEFTNEGNILLRAINNIHGQRVLAYMKCYEGVEGKWLEPNDWEDNYYKDLETFKQVKKKKLFKKKFKVKLKKSKLNKRGK